VSISASDRVRAVRIEVRRPAIRSSARVPVRSQQRLSIEKLTYKRVNVYFLPISSNSQALKVAIFGLSAFAAG